MKTPVATSPNVSPLLAAAIAALCATQAIRAADLNVGSTVSPMTLSGGSYSYDSVMISPEGQGAGTLNIVNGVTLTCTTFYNGSGSGGGVNQTGGDVTVTGTALASGEGVGDTNRLNLGGWGNAYQSFYTLSGGTLTATAGVATLGSDDCGTLTISGGAANLLGLYASWRNKGALTLTSGTLSLGAYGIAPSPAPAASFPTWTGTLTFNGGTLKLSGGGAIAVDFGTGTVNALFFDGVQQAAGTWGKTGSGAAHINDTYFKGSGTLTVTSGGTTSDYDTWKATDFGLPFSDTDPASDPDGDGLSNQQEYAFGLNPTSGASANPITQQLDKASGTFKYTRRKTSGLPYIYQWSTTLSAPWPDFTPVTTPPATASVSPTVEEVTVVIPPSLLAEPRLFVRVKAD